MKIQRKNRIINNNTTNIGLIFLASTCNTTSKKELKLNKTKLYHTDNNYITIVNSEDWITNLDKIIDTKNILDIIDIYLILYQHHAIMIYISIINLV